MLFIDGETLPAKTEGYNPQKIGFFAFPLDAKSNNLRIFVVTQDAKQIKFI
ncbi:MAG TPA: hypothetical protein VFM21_08430 [Terriglobia bacterium]|nr:hypothetical protein [Terriglobia bacterium]